MIIEEIYHLLRITADIQTIDLVGKILTSNMDVIWYINYTGLEFKLNLFSHMVPVGTIIVPDTNIKISYEELFV